MAVYLGFHWLTTWLLVAELVRLTAPEEFLWLMESPLWTDGGALLGSLFAGLAVLLVVRPGWARVGSRAGPPLLMALAMVVNLAWIHSLAWWVIIAAGVLAWAGWVAHLALGQGRPLLMAFLVVAHHALLAFLYLDTRFFAATNAHLSLLHIWFLQFRGVVAVAGLSSATVRVLLTTAGGYVAVTALLGFCLRDRLSPPGRSGLRLGLAAVVLAVHLVQFEALAGMVPLPAYLTFRFQFGSRLVPQVSRFRQPAFRAAWDGLPTLDPAAFYRPGRFAWRSLAGQPPEAPLRVAPVPATPAVASPGANPFGFVLPGPGIAFDDSACGPPTRPHLVILLIESWRADLLETGMPLLARRARRGLWLRQHFAQANSTPPTVAALLHGCLPVDYLLQAYRLGEVPFFRFLRDSGYAWHLVQGNPPEGGLEGIDRLFMGFTIHPPRGAPSDWPALTATALEVVPSLVQGATPTLVVAYLYSTHFDYRYPDDFERYRPALPEGTEVLSLTPNPETVRGIVNRYKNALGFLDDRLERFFRQLEASGAASRTWVVLVGDHGESLGDAGFFAHATGPHISQFHVPCLIFGPGLPPQVIDRPTQHVDLVPTLAALLGIEVQGLVGQDVRVASRAAVVSFDFSADRRLIVRSPARMSLFDLDGHGRLDWVLTVRNDFALDEPLVQAYLASDAVVLAGLIRQDATWLSELLQPVP